METKFLISCLCFLFVFILIPGLQAELGPYLVRNYSDKDGLSMNIGVSIVQDKMGYIWIGTQQGLNRFDGVDVKTITAEDEHGIPNNFVNSLFVDKKGNLWVATRGGFAHYDYNNGSFVKYKEKDTELAHDNVRCFAECNKYGLLIGTEGGLCAMNKRGIINLAERHELLGHKISSIAVNDSEDKIYLGTPGNGIIVFQVGKAETTTQLKKGKILKSDYIYALCLDKENLWIGTDNGLTLYNGKEFIRTYTTNDLLSDNGIRALFMDKENTLWIGTAGGLNYRRDGKIYNFDSPSTRSEKLEGRSILSFCQDHEKGLWVGTRSGVSYLTEGIFTTYSETNGLAYNLSFGIYEDKNHRIWIATYGGLTVICDGKDNVKKIQSFTTEDYLPGNALRTVTSDKAGNIWIGTDSGGLIKGKIISPENSEKIKMNFKQYTVKNNLPSNNVRVAYVDSKDHLWLGMQDGGLIKFDKYSGRVIDHYDSKKGKPEHRLLNDNVWFIKEDTKGNLWIGVDDGICKFDGEKFTNYTEKDGLKCKDTQTILEDGNGYWITTFGNGLYYLEEKKSKAVFTWYTKKNGLPDDYIYGVEKIDEEYLWIVTNKGICQWNKKSEKMINHFTVDNGFPSNENSPQSGYKDSIGNIWFSTPKGVACIDPKNIPENKKAPNVYIEEVIVKDRNDNEIKTDTGLFEKNPLILGHDENNLYIKFTAISYQFPDAVKFDYILEGYQDQWVKQTNKRFVEFPNLPHGKYTFKVRAYNNDGVPGNTDAKYSFAIKPAFYETWIFRVIIAMLFFLMIYGFFRYRLAHKEQKRKELERVIAKRTEEIKNMQVQLIQQDKMAALGTLVAGVAHELNNPVSFIKMNAEFFAKAWEEISTILDEYAKYNTGLEITGLPYHDSKKEMEKLISGLLEGSNRISRIINGLRTFSKKDDPSNKQIININKVIEAAINLTRNLIKNATNCFSYELMDSLPDIYGNFQRLEQVVINLIQNACQALSEKSQGIFISTTFDKQTQRVVIKVKDEGVGIDTQIIKYITDPFFTTKRDSGCIGLGLSISYQVVKEHGGEIDFESIPNQGTTVSIYLPVKPLKTAAKQSIMEVKP